MTVVLTGNMRDISSRSIIVLLRPSQRIQFIQGDVRYTELLKAKLAFQLIDAVVHFIGLKAVSKSVEQ